MSDKHCSATAGLLFLADGRKVMQADGQRSLSDPAA
jgi:hypothetical protein